MRGLPRRMLSLKGFFHLGFILLEEDHSEVVIGLVAQPWKLTGNIMKMTPEKFVGFKELDYVKVVWNFNLTKINEGQINISTATRIHCTSSKAKRRFSMYWFVIGFFSGMIRKEMLKVMKQEILKSNSGKSE
ncbi:hypothetical protein [Paenibacillus sp. KN14-4R]|uniref:hypothetical protein n=1 Tax=Paenibacillus sp. KN14-4R TaxID=3445773 RepID=UPI003FA05EE2